jgi:1-acyl-sn-glycerol-3-phosphate acyltransferase
VQSVVGPLTHNYALTRLTYRGLGRLLFGYKFEFNKAASPLVKDKRAMFLVNHMSVTDFLPIRSMFKGAVIGKHEIGKWPVVGLMVRATQFIGVKREAKYNAESRGKIIRNFNKGYNATMCPEATVTPGDKVYLFHAGLLSVFFGDKAVDKKQRNVTLKSDVVVQPVAIRVKSVNGKDATGNAELRNLYRMYGERNILRNLWKRFQVRNITLELTPLEPLNPKDFNNAKDLANAAARAVATVISPGQTEFEPAFKAGKIVSQNPPASGKPTAPPSAPPAAA